MLRVTRRFLSGRENRNLCDEFGMNVWPEIKPPINLQSHDLSWTSLLRCKSRTVWRWKWGEAAFSLFSHCAICIITLFVSTVYVLVCYIIITGLTADMRRLPHEFPTQCIESYSTCLVCIVQTACSIPTNTSQFLRIRSLLNKMQEMDCLQQGIPQYRKLNTRKLPTEKS